MCYQCLNLILLRVKTLQNSELICVGPSVPASVSAPLITRQPLIPPIFDDTHNPLRVFTLASDWSDLLTSGSWLVGMAPCLYIWRNPSVHIFCQLNALNPVMIPGWEMTECGCHKILESDTKYPETWHDTCRGVMTSGQGPWAMCVMSNS